MPLVPVTFNYPPRERRLLASDYCDCNNQVRPRFIRAPFHSISGGISSHLGRGTKMRSGNLSLMLAALLVTCGTAAAQFTIDIKVDEFGNGTFNNSNGVSVPLTAGLQPDPGPGGLPAALTYGLPG